MLSTAATRARRRRLAVVAAAGVVVAAMMPGVALGSSGPDAEERVVPKIEGLDGPRGIAVGPNRRMVYTQADGTVTETVLRGKEAGTEVLGTAGPPGFASAVSQRNPQAAHIVTGGGGPLPGFASLFTWPGRAAETAVANAQGGGGATLFKWSRERGEIFELADIAAYQETDPDPDNQEGPPEESNPFGVASLDDGSVLVADAAGNDLLRVYRNGDIETVARIKPRIVLVPEELDGIKGMPPPGTPINAEGVATSVTIGADGAYYIGELRGFPATPETSAVWRVEPDSVDAVCDHDNPQSGDCTRYADGFTSIVDLGAGPDGEIYVVELVKGSWLQFELEITGPEGSLFRIPAGGGSAQELGRGRLDLPGGVDVSTTGRPFVAGPVFGPGQIVRVR